MRHVNRDVRAAYQEYELRIYGVPATLLSYVRRMCEYVRRIGPATYVLRIFKCTHKNVAPRCMRSMSYVSRSMSYVCSRMYDVRVTYLSYLDTPKIRELIRNSVTAV